MPPPSKKANSLSIRLVESAVYLRSNAPAARRRRGNHDPDARTSVLRGLLVLDLVKPTKITSIDVELVATTDTAWPEGIGARRVEISEEHRVYQASTVYFQSSKTPSSRRTLSIGPGVTYDAEEYDSEADDDDELDGPERQRHDQTSENVNEQHPQHVPLSSIPSSSVVQVPVQTPWHHRRVSIDSAQFQRANFAQQQTFHHPDNDNVILEADSEELTPTPPYSLHAPSAIALSPSSVTRTSSSGSSGTTDPAQSLEEFRHSLNHTLRHGGQPPRSPNHSLSSISRNRELTTLNAHAAIPEHEQLLMVAGSLSMAGVSTPRPTSVPRSRTPSRREDPTSHSRPHTRSPSHHRRTSAPFVDEPLSASQPTSSRKASRFSFSAVSHALKDAVRSGSPRSSSFARSKERGIREDRERSTERHNTDNRGRTMERGGKGNGFLVQDFEEEKGSTGVFGKLLGEVDGREFKKGTYTYPISFNIPGNAPPSMNCDYGSVTWKLKANVHRPGTFKSKMTAVREVIMVTCPTEEDTEDTENITVERNWDNQLQYLISVSGRSFYVGGTLPVTFTLLPLNKVKVHRISVFVEERVDYYTNMRRVARSDPLTKFTLLSIRKEGKDAGHILPLDSDDPDAFRHSPLYQVLGPDDDVSSLASSLMGPGPWTFHKDLKLPSNCQTMKFTNRNKRANILVTHTLKLVMRVERGDDMYIDPKTGKRKMFDIVVQTPILILSCRCNPEWSTLPRYKEVFDDVGDVTPNCPCQAERSPTFLQRIYSSQSTDSSSASAAETSPVNLGPGSLRRPALNDLFERLVSGQETESGEAPPAYDACAREPLVRHTSRVNGAAGPIVVR